jgi:subtilisin family serine protease
MTTAHATRGLLLATLALVALAGAAGAGAGARSAERSYITAVRGNYVPGQVIVGYRAHTSRAEVVRVHGRVPSRVTQRFANLRIEVVRLAPGLSVSEAVRRYERDPSVSFAEPNYTRSPQANLFTDLWGLNNTGQSHPVSDADGDNTADPSSGNADADIDAPEAWAAATDLTNHPIIAVIDTGVDVSHPDLATQLWQNPGETCLTCLPTVDDDGNGKVDDINGWDFANNLPDGDNTLLSANHSWVGWDHGTHVAGTIAGDDDNDGIVGVCPLCKIMVLKIARDSDGQLLLSAEIAALSYAKANGARIANMSFGGPDWSNAERNAIKNSGLLAVVSAGNEALDNDMFLYADLFPGNPNPDTFSPSFPASFTLSNILAVGASNDHNENAYSTECHSATGLGLSKPDCAFTNWGHDSVDLAAPGVDIESSVPSSSWETWDGTSMAAPHVAGTAGLVLSQHSTYTVSQLKNALMHSVDKPNSLRTIYMPDYVDQTGHPRTKTGAFSRTTGRVNAFKALTAGTSSATPLTDGNVNGAKSFSGSSVFGSVSWPADVNDVKKKKLLKAHLYRVTLVVPAHKDYDLFVWKPGAKELWNNNKFQKASQRIGSGDEQVQFLAGSTGTYYFQVMAWLFKSGTYKLTVKKLA